MTLTDRANRALKQIDAELAVCDAATPGKWTVSDLGFVCGTHEPIADCIFDACKNHRADATLIATARTGYPAALRGLKVAIEGFLKLANSDVSADEAHACNHPCDASEHLNSILTIWEGGRE